MKLLKGNIFDSNAQTLVNPVNCVGVMGKGLALQFRRRFPSMYKDYVGRCKAGALRPGAPYLYSAQTPWIINFPTKLHWRTPSKLEWVEAGLQTIASSYKDWGIESLAVPPLGCGLGGLKWSNVLPLIETYLNLSIEVEVYKL